MIDILTGTAFDALKRFARRADEVVAKFPSAVSSRTRGLLALKAQNWRVAKPEPEPEPEPAGNAYIETDGQSYMDLGFVPTVSMDYEIDMRFVQPAGKTATAYGTYSTTNTGCRYRLSETTTLIIMTNPTITWGSYDRRVENAMSRHVYALHGDMYHIDGVEFAAGSRNPASGNMQIGTSVASGPRSRIAVYSAKFWDDGVLVRDLVPYSGERGVGLLDKVHDVLYTNAGGGSLTYGVESSSVVPYIETDGVASYIDLGFVPTEPFAFEVTFKLDSAILAEGVTNPAIMGAGDRIFGRYSIRNVNNQESSNIQISDPRLSIFSNNLYDKHVVSYSAGKIVADGEELEWTPTTPAKNNMILGGFAFGPTGPYQPSKTRFYSAKFWCDGVLVRDLVPYSGERGVGLLDKVHDVLYTNARDGSLTYGEEGGTWENPYITDGLLAMWDSEWNEAGGVHNPDFMQLNDLMGNLGPIPVSALGDKWSVRPAGVTVSLSRSEYPALNAFLKEDGTFARTLDGCSSFEVPSGELPAGTRTMISGMIYLNSGAGSATTMYLGYGVTSSGKCYNTRAMLTQVVSEIDGIDGVPRTYCCRMRTMGPLPAAATAYMDGVEYGRYSGSTTSTRYENVTKMSIAGPTANYADLVRHRCLRLYSRELTDAEIAHNARVDRERFGGA